MNGKDFDMERRTFLRNGLLIGAIGVFAGCQHPPVSMVLSEIWMHHRSRFTAPPPKYDILLKGEIRIAVVPRSTCSNASELQDASREIARHVNSLLVKNVRNKRLRVIEQSKVEEWLDNNNDFDNFLEVGRDEAIKADIVIGFDIVGLQDGKCHVQITAIDVWTGKRLASESLTPDTSLAEKFFFIAVARQIAVLFHHDYPPWIPMHYPPQISIL